METKYKVLIVEDDDLTRQIYFERLSLDKEIEVDNAVDGLDALNKIQDSNYDLIFSGIQMPNKTGFELYEEMKKNPELSQIPFVIFSHLGRLEDMQKARDLGIKHFIVRGTTTPDKVNQIIRDIISNNVSDIKYSMSNYNVLIVEDDSEIRSLYADVFGQHSNINVETAVDGLDALNKLIENKYDLIFSGIQMPNKTGFELYQEVQKLTDKNNIPIVLFSHLGRSEDIEMAKNLGIKYLIIRGQSSPNDTLNQILDILSARDKNYSLVIKKDSKDYDKFVKAFLGEDCIEYENLDGMPIKVVLSKDLKPYTFFIELDCDK